VLSVAPTVRLMTSVALPVIRGPFALAKTLGALDLLSGGRLDAGLGPAPRPRTTRSSASRTPSDGRASTRQSEPSGRSGRTTARHSPGSSTTRPSSAWPLALRSRTVRRSGSGAGVRRRACGASRGSVTAGWRPATTRPPRAS
jgi:alkanesulfonate monooxygenase SsuD/methylene tetrahydromethanopterin reductase-like flavin-dependent oxidoreductase (luciferase family)